MPLKNNSLNQTCVGNLNTEKQFRKTFAIKLLPKVPSSSAQAAIELMNATTERRIINKINFQIFTFCFSILVLMGYNVYRLAEGSEKELYPLKFASTFDKDIKFSLGPLPCCWLPASTLINQPTCLSLNISIKEARSLSTSASVLSSVISLSMLTFVLTNGMTS